MEEVKPASSEELQAFLAQNRRWLSEDAETLLRGLNGLDQRRVILGGTMSSVQNPVAVIQARVRKAKELEAAVSCEGKVPAVLLGLESKLVKPATPEDLDAFIKANDRWLGDEAVKTLRSMSGVDQRRVISAGTMSGCRDPVAVIQTRAKKAREMELEIENLAAGKGPLRRKEKPEPAAPSFGEEAAAMHLYAPPEEVSANESRFAPPVRDHADSALVGDVPGVGGVVEMLKPKYGCSKGQRIRVIGETHALLQFEGGKTAPKNHEGSGWKWVIREEEELKRSAAEAQMAALKHAAAVQLAQVEAQKAAELARAQAEAKAYAAAQESQDLSPPERATSRSSSCSKSSGAQESKARRSKVSRDETSESSRSRSSKQKKAVKKARKRAKKAVLKAQKSKKKKESKKDSKKESKKESKKAQKTKDKANGKRRLPSSSSATDVTLIDGL